MVNFDKGTLSGKNLSRALAVTDAYGREEYILRKHRPGFCEGL